MAEPEIDLNAIARGTVTAPAGCGKTHLIAQTLARSSTAKPVLVLTHTNAGVAALRDRLDRAQVSPRLYKLSTIDGLAMRLIATFPRRSGHDPEILSLRTPRTDYPKIRQAADELLRAGHVSDVISASYSRLLVDEHQDCSLVQHSIVSHAAKTLPTCVLGDPLQGIFGFQGNALVDWNENVCRDFAPAGELSTPWRWRNAGAEDFGHWLLDVRRRLLANQAIDLNSAPKYVTWIHLDGTADHERRLTAARTRTNDPNGGVLIIGDSINPTGQRDFASQTPGAVTVESVDLRDLVAFAQSFDLKAPNALDQLVGFAQDVMTNVGGADMLRRVQSLKNGTARNPATDAERVALAFAAAPSHLGAVELLAEIGKQGGVRTHRPAVLQACIRALRLCKNDGENALYEVAVQVREQSRLLGRPLPRRAVGSTLLLKGLEAHVAVVLNADALDAPNLYVAMTRGSKALVICSSTSVLNPR